MPSDEPVAHVTLIRRERPVEGFKYRIDISFAKKPDYSKVRQEAIRGLGKHDKLSPDELNSNTIWEYILLEATHPEVVRLWKMVEPVTDKITDIVLIASSMALGIEWHRVRLFVLSDEKLDADEFHHQLDSAMDDYFGESTSKSVRFLDIVKLAKFPREGRLISKTDIQLTMKMISDAGDRLEKKTS